MKRLNRAWTFGPGVNPSTNVVQLASTLCCWSLACFAQAGEPWLIPNDDIDIGSSDRPWPTWPVGMPQQDLPKHVEREYKLGVPSWAGSVVDLAMGVDALLREAVEAESWQAPPLVMAGDQSSYAIRVTPMEEKVFADFYFDNNTRLNWRHGVSYRLRQRFEHESDWTNYMAGVDQAYPNRVEFMTKLHRKAMTESPGLTETEEYRFKTQNGLGRHALPDMLKFFSLGRVPHDFEYKDVEVRRGDVGNPAWALVEFYRRSELAESAFHDDERFAFSPRVYIKTKRRRQHLVYTPSQKFRDLVGEDQETFQAFIISVDHAYVWQAGEIMAYVTGEVATLPEPRGNFVEVELEFDRSTAARIDKTILSTREDAVARELIAIREAFVKDLEHLNGLLGKRFHTVPKHRSKYSQARSLAYPDWDLGVLTGGLTIKHVPPGSGAALEFSFTPKYSGPVAVELKGGSPMTASLLQSGVGEIAGGQGEMVYLETEVTATRPCELRVDADGSAYPFEMRIVCPDAFDELRPPPVLDLVPGVSHIGNLSLVGASKDAFRFRSPVPTMVEFHCDYVGNGAVKLQFFESDSWRRVESSAPDPAHNGVARMAAHLEPNQTYSLGIAGEGMDTSPCTYSLTWDCHFDSQSPRQDLGIAIRQLNRDIIALDLGPADFKSHLERNDALGSGRWCFASPRPLPRGGAFRLYERRGIRQAYFRRKRLSAGPDDIVLNEVSSVNSVGDFVEIFNRSDEAFVFPDETWSVKDENDSAGYTIPGGTIIPGGGFLLIDRGELGFGLGGSDRVRLYRGTTVHDVTRWKGHVQSRGRFPDGGAWLSTDTEPTPGMANAAPLASGYSESF